ncbi:MAG: hypothetical protein IJX30_06265 [Clostridia bacterium]|nr:hypothetical protein [Clostridia bacterium]
MGKEFSKNRLLENVARFAVYFAAVMITPWIAKPLALLFDWVCYEQMIMFFEELFTSIFWVVELCVFFVLEKKRREKRLAVLEEKTENEGGMSATEQNIGEEKEKKTKKEIPLLPLKNVFAIFACICLCILVISAQIDFQVKLFYDIGQGKGGYDLVNYIAQVGKNVVKCIWIVWMLRVARIIAEEVSHLRKKNVDQKTAYWCIYLAIVLLFALYDVLASGMGFGFAITYMLLFYPVFMTVDYLTNYNGVKSFFMIMLIYVL